MWRGESLTLYSSRPNNAINRLKRNYTTAIVSNINVFVWCSRTTAVDTLRNLCTEEAAAELQESKGLSYGGSFGGSF